MATHPTIPELGKIFQIAYVAKDLDAAIANWAALGIGPFFVMDRAPFSQCSYRGVPADIEMSVAISYWGDVQIEIIHQTNETLSPYSAWQNADTKGVHHMCILVENIADARAYCVAQGRELLLEAVSDGIGQFIYADFAKPLGCLVEFAQLEPMMPVIFDKIRNACQSWDSTRPRRQIVELLS